MKIVATELELCEKLCTKHYMIILVHINKRFERENR